MQSGHSNIQITFVKATPKEFYTAENLTKALTDFYHLNKPEGNPHISLHEFHVDDNWINLTVSSMRLKNLDWQVKLIISYIQANNIELGEFNASGYTETDYGSHYYEGNEINDPEEILSEIDK